MRSSGSGIFDREIIACAIMDKSQSEEVIHGN